MVAQDFSRFMQSIDPATLGAALTNPAAEPFSTDLIEPGQVSKHRYFAEDFAELERKRLWPRVWLHAAATGLITEPGMYVTVQLGGVADIVVIRGKDRVIR